MPADVKEKVSSELKEEGKGAKVGEGGGEMDGGQTHRSRHGDECLSHGERDRQAQHDGVESDRLDPAA